MRNDKVLVVGASGVIGRRLCRVLRDRSVDVVGLARFGDADRRRALEVIGVQTIPFDLLQDDPGALPDVRTVFLEIWDPSQHGGKGAREAIWALNYTAIGRLVARYAGRADVINGCTGNVYGTGPDAKSEADPPRPNDEYGLARLAQEHLISFLCDRAGSKAIHLRYYHSNRPGFGRIHAIAKAVLAAESLGDQPDRRLQVIGLEDFVRCTVLAAERIDGLPRAVNVCHPRVWTLRELAERIARQLGSGQVVFDRQTGGHEDSVIGDPACMIEHFGPPREDLDELIARICAAV